MASPSPSWRVKSRPCPFYSQGRCLFAHSCNFMHEVKVHCSPDTETSVTVSNKPVQSPRSGRIPTRSPRLSQLLLALQDVIGVEAEDEAIPEDNTHSDEPGNSSQESDDPWTFVDNSGSISSETLGPESPIHENACLGPSQDHQPVIMSIPYFEADDSIAAPTPPGYVSPPKRPSEKPARLSLDLLSPISVPNLPRIPFLQDESIKCNQSIDSGYADSLTSLQPMRLSPPRSPTRFSSTFDLLSSPFGLPSSRVLSPRLTTFMGRLSGTDTSSSPRRGSYLSAADAEAHTPLRPDSGYDTDRQSALDTVNDLTNFGPEDEETTIKFVGTPNPLCHQTPRRSSPDYFLALESTESGDDESLAGATRDSLNNRIEPIVDSETDFPSLDHPPINSESSDAEPSIRPDNRSTLVDASPPMSVTEDEGTLHVSSPNHEDMAALTIVSPLDPSFSDTLTAAQSNECTVLSPPSSSLRAANLSDPAVPPVGDDTLNTIYDTYCSTVPPPANVGAVNEALESGSSFTEAPNLSDGLSRSGSASPPVSLTHGRVFTPPSSRGRMGTFFGSPLTSPLSQTSSPAKLSSPFCTSSPDRGRVFTTVDRTSEAPVDFSQSPASLIRANQGSPEPLPAREKGKYPARSPGGESDGPRAETSTRVPFGFRHSSSLGNTKSSSNRISRSIPPPLTKLRIITDPTKARSATDSPISAKPRTSPLSLSASPITSGLKPLRLSTISSANHHISSSPILRQSSITSPPGYIKRFSMSSTSVSSDFSISHNYLLSSTRTSLIPSHIRNTLVPVQDNPLSPLSLDDFNSFPDRRPPQSAPVSHSHSWNTTPHHTLSHRNQPYTDSRNVLSNEPFESISSDDDEKNNDNDGEGGDDILNDHTIRLPIPHSAPISRPTPSMRSSYHAIATPSPTLMFAIASDDPARVRKVLESGDAGPNDQVGPQSALAFTLTNSQLTHKVEMVKTLLAFGADPAALKNTELNHSPRRVASDDDTSTSSSIAPSLLEGMDPATRYYVGRANEPNTRQTSALIYRSCFRPLTRVRYDMIGQDRALEQLFRVLSIHSQQLSITPIVVLLCGPSGHGKSLLARKFGSHLDVPTHTVNMTTLRSTHELWQSYSMSPYEEPSDCTLADFLMNNEGKRCVVVLDEIDKMEDDRTLWSLLMPWELGRCSVEANSRYLDVRNVIWLGTSNIGHDLIFQHHETRQSPNELMSREEYLALTGQLRPCVSERLGASLLSRVTTVLPFVPFSLDEKKAVAAEALYTLAGERLATLPPPAVESLVLQAVSGYIPAEGARSLYRAVSSQLIDCI